MKKRDIETYMDAFMEGFWQCYNVMFDLIEDDEWVVQAEPIKTDMTVEELTQKIVENQPKSRLVPEPTHVPHAPDKPTKTPMPKVKTPKKKPPTHEEYVELFKQGKLPTEVAKALGVAPQTAYNHLYKARQDGDLK